MLRTKVSIYLIAVKVLFEFNNNLTVNNFKEENNVNDFSKDRILGSKILYFLIIIILAAIITAPLFIIFYRYFPNMIINIGITIRLDMILCFLGIFILIFTLLRFLKQKFIYGFIGSFVVVMAMLQLLNIYSFQQMKQSYFDLINYVENNPIELPFMSENQMTIRNAAAIKAAVDYENPKLRNFAVAASTKYFNEKGYYSTYGNIIRYFSVFKVINEWDYVPDPKGLDYFAPASQSINLMAGDCDDHAIVMAAAIMAIGGEARLVHTKKHLYPEVNVGKKKDLSKIYYLVKRLLFYKESMGNQLFYHIDKEDNIWLNFDYTGKYPGAKFMDQQIIGLLNL